MSMIHRTRVRVCLLGVMALPSMLIATSALAQGMANTVASDESSESGDASASEPTSPFSISANMSIFSDYRFRGASLTDRQPAIQGGVDLGYAVSDSFSFYLGNWNSTLKKRTGYGSEEMDFYGGVQGTFKGFSWKAGGYGYVYPGKKGLDYYEITGEVGHSIGPVTAAVGTYIAPKQKAYGNITGVYVYGNASYAIPKTPMTLKGGLGYEKNSIYTKRGDGPGKKLDWNIGLSATFDKINLGISYIDTNRKTPFERRDGRIRKQSGATVVGNVGVVF